MAVLIGLTACVDPAPPEVGSSGSSPGSTTTVHATVEIYGDSLTVADSPDLRAGQAGTESWVLYLPDDGITVTGAAGRWGATADEVHREHLLAEGEADDADLLVLFLGTNDAGRAGSAGSATFTGAHADYVDSLGQIAAQATYDPAQVVIVEVGPADAGDPERTEAWNALTEEAAAELGWHLVDPWEQLRGPGGRYADPSYTTDGLHLSEAGAVVLAEGMAAELIEVMDSTTP